MIIGDTIQLKPGVITDKPREGIIVYMRDFWANIRSEQGYAVVYLPYYIKKEPMTTQLNKKAKPSTKPQADKFFVYKIDGGILRVVFNTYEDAKNEATRLAEANPNNEFVVLGVVYSVKKVPVYTTEATEYSV